MNTENQKINTLVIEDDPTTANAIKDVLLNLNCAVQIKGSFQDGLHALQENNYSLIVLDRMLPDGDSIDGIAKIKATGSQAYLFVVSALGQASNKIEGLDRGADDYLSKPFDPAELKARLRALLRRFESNVSDNDIAAFGDIELRIKSRTLHINSEFVPISPKEFKLLYYFAQNEKDVVTRSQLLENVWNIHFDPQTNVVDVHVGRLRRKLEKVAKRPIIHTARGAGYVFDPFISMDDT